MYHPAYLVSDLAVEFAMQGKFLGDVYILLQWEVFHEVMDHEGPAELCEACATMFARQFQQPSMRRDDDAW